MPRPKQAVLPFEPQPRAREAQRGKTKSYEAQNREAAEIILADPAKYGGPEAAVAQWARRALARALRGSGKIFVTSRQPEDTIA